MRRTLCTLMTLGVLTGCGGSDDSATVAADRTAPTLTVTSTTTTPMSGDTIVISVAATDNRDPTVSYVLSCTGGRLTGNSLVLPVVTADTQIQCTATATDAAGNSGTGSLTLTVKASTARATLSSGSEAVTAGGSGLIRIDNLTLSQESYDATIGGRSVKLARISGTELMFTTPLDLSAGTQKLEFTINNRPFALDLSVGAAIAVADPRNAIATMMNDSKSRIAARIADGATSAADRATLQDASATIDRAITALSSVSDADIAKLAGFLAANGAISSGGVTAMAYNPIQVGSDCVPALKAFVRPAVLAIAGAVWLNSAVSVALAVGAAAPALVVPDIIFAGLGIGAGTALTVLKGRQAYNAYGDMKTKCWTETTIDLLSFLDSQSTSRDVVTVRAVAVAQKQAFTNKASRMFRVSRSFAPQEAVRAEIAQVFGDIVGRVIASPFITTDLRAQLSELKTEGSEIVPAASIGLANISRGDLTGSLEAVSADVVRITFTYTGQTQPSDNVDFTFNLTRTGEENVGVSAQLSVKLPEADDASLEVAQGGVATSKVQARGSTSLEIVRQPANGSVTLAADGTFRYTPTGTFFGSDSFTYRARNEQGVSREATVSLSVVRRFDGNWNIRTQSTTMSQSSPGLCPNESNSFTVLVSKISDTQYVANYQGYDLTLTMTTKDDAAGPTGSRTVTYPDSPGQTTETVTVRIPDSQRLFGTSFFEYSGPNGTSCKGNVQITGTR